MEILPVYFLVAYNILFFWKSYKNPYRNSTGEIASTFFPHWRWLGQQKGSLKDDLYFFHSARIPFLSTYYPISWILSKLMAQVSLDRAFLAFSHMIHLHYLLGSVLSYFMFLKFSDPLVALFGAVTWTYAAYNVKTQTPCIAYMHAWIPGMFLGGWFSIISCTMVILAGYWPLAVFIIPVASFLYPETLLGIVLAVPQIIPFIVYWQKSVRSKHTPDKNFGRVPLWKFSGLFQRNINRRSVNGVLFPEMELYCGIITIILAFFGTSRIILILMMSLVLSMGMVRPIFRIPARSLHLFTFSLVWLAVAGLNNLTLSEGALTGLILLQGFDLLRNSEIFPMFPFQEWWRKPTEFFNTPLTRYLQTEGRGYRVSGLPHPLFTGYINNIQTLGYNGGFQLKEMAELRGDDNPNGSGAHDWFKLGEDGEKLDQYGVKFAYKPHKTLVDEKWKQTPIKHLYRNLQAQKPIIF